jgi:hypothetical protein
MRLHVEEEEDMLVAYLLPNNRQRGEHVDTMDW